VLPAAILLLAVSYFLLKRSESNHWPLSRGARECGYLKKR